MSDKFIRYKFVASQTKGHCLALVGDVVKRYYVLPVADLVRAATDQPDPLSIYLPTAPRIKAG